MRELLIGSTLFFSITLLCFNNTLCNIDSKAYTETNTSDTSFYFIINRNQQTDTLYIHRKSNIYTIRFKGKQVFKRTSYNTPSGFIKPLNQVKSHKLFILNIQESDGCPSYYQLLFFSGNTVNPGERFGNCNDYRKMEFKYPYLKFTFDADTTLNRKAQIKILNVNKLYKEPRTITNVCSDR